MLDTGLFRLFQLHQVDAALHELKSHAGALDTGQAESAEMKRLMAEHEAERALPKKLRQEQTDLELEQKALQDKKKTLDRKLYDGSMVNSKEIAAMEQEIASLAVRIDQMDDRLLELLDEVPAAEAAARKIDQELALLKKAILEKQALAKSEHESLRAAYAQTAKKREPALAKVPKALVDQYEQLKSRIGVPAMAVITRESSCGACGILIAERVREQVRLDRVTNCESCRRILFIPVPNVLGEDE